jgi:hypothetical protein
MPLRVHTVRGPNTGTGTSPGQGSALTIVVAQQAHASDRTPLTSILPSVVGSGIVVVCPRRCSGGTDLRDLPVNCRAPLAARGEVRYRGLAKARKIRARLGSSANVFPEGPKGMRRRTYVRLRHSHDIGALCGGC